MTRARAGVRSHLRAAVSSFAALRPSRRTASLGADVLLLLQHPTTTSQCLLSYTIKHPVYSHGRRAPERPFSCPTRTSRPPLLTFPMFSSPQAISHEQYLSNNTARETCPAARRVQNTYRRSPKSPSPGIMYAFSFSPSSIHPVICRPIQLCTPTTHPTTTINSLTTLVCGYVTQKFCRPSGDAIYTKEHGAHSPSASPVRSLSFGPAASHREACGLQV